MLYIIHLLRIPRE